MIHLRRPAKRFATQKARPRPAWKKLEERLAGRKCRAKRSTQVLNAPKTSTVPVLYQEQWRDSRHRARSRSGALGSGRGGGARPVARRVQRLARGLNHLRRQTSTMKAAVETKTAMPSPVITLCSSCQLSVDANPAAKKPIDPPASQPVFQ